MSTSGNLEGRFCNDGESVKVLRKRLSEADVRALNKAADMLLTTLTPEVERTISVTPASAREIGSAAARGSETYPAYIADGQASYATLF